MDAGEAIRFLRKRDNLSQKELAERLGVTTASVKKYESGNVNLSLSTIRSLCSIFKTAPFAFVYPEAWRRAQLDQSTGISEFYHIVAVYSRMTDEGKQRIIDYIDDIGQIDRYVRKDVSEYEEMYELFMHFAERGSEKPESETQ